MIQGLVVKSTGSWYNVRTAEAEIIECRIKGNFRIKGLKSTNPIAVGDKVQFEIEKDNDSEAAKRGVIFKIEPRKNYIVRKSINLSRQTHILAANIDRAYLIVTIANPKTSLGFIDRFLVTAETYSIPVTIVFNKMDTYNADELLEVENRTALYTKIGYTCISMSSLQEIDLAQLRMALIDKINLLSGHSGVGKSTLINGLDHNLNLKTGIVSNAHQKGKHTTTFAEMHELKTGGFIIDTPGIKEIGIVDIEANELWSYFPEIRSLVNQCKFDNCRHLNEPGCKVKEAVENGHIAASRYASYLSIFLGENHQ